MCRRETLCGSVQTHSLVNRTRRRPKHNIGIACDQPDGSSHDHEYDCQCHSIFRDILSLVVEPEFGEEGEGHICTSLCEFRTGTLCCTLVMKQR